MEVSVNWDNVLDDLATALTAVLMFLIVAVMIAVFWAVGYVILPESWLAAGDAHAVARVMVGMFVTIPTVLLLVRYINVSMEEEQ